MRHILTVCGEAIPVTRPPKKVNMHIPLLVENHLFDTLRAE